MSELRTILLAEDNPKDVELTIEAMAENNLANQVVVVKTAWKHWNICDAKESTNFANRATPS